MTTTTIALHYFNPDWGHNACPTFDDEASARAAARELADKYGSRVVLTLDGKTAHEVFDPR